MMPVESNVDSCRVDRALCMYVCACVRACFSRLRYCCTRRYSFHPTTPIRALFVVANCVVRRSLDRKVRAAAAAPAVWIKRPAAGDDVAVDATLRLIRSTAACSELSALIGKFFTFNRWQKASGDGLKQIPYHVTSVR